MAKSEKSRPGLKERFRRSLFGLYRRSETKIHQLKSVLWECTLRCNLNCGHCGSDCKASSGMPDADEKLFYSALEDIRKSQDPSKVMVGITGGEPIMRNDLANIISEVRSMGFPVGIVSNGFALTPRKFVELVNSGLNSLTISLDGLEKEHNSLRKHPKSFANAMLAIRNAAEFVRQSMGRTPFDFDVVTCVHPGNIGTLHGIRDVLFLAGVRNWRLFGIFPSGRAEDGGFQLSKEQYYSMLDFISWERDKGEMNISYSCEGWLGDYEMRARGSYYFCRAGITNAGIFADGSVGGCISVRSRDFIAGNLHDKPFMKIWNEDFGVFRDRSWTKIGRCAGCSEYRHCLGNGLHLYSSLQSGPVRCSLPESFGEPCSNIRPDGV